MSEIQTSLGLREENESYRLKVQVSKGISKEGLFVGKKIDLLIIKTKLKPQKNTGSKPPSKPIQLKQTPAICFSPRYKLN